MYARGIAQQDEERAAKALCKAKCQYCAARSANAMQELAKILLAAKKAGDAGLRLRPWLKPQGNMGQAEFGMLAPDIREMWHKVNTAIFDCGSFS